MPKAIKLILGAILIEIGVCLILACACRCQYQPKTCAQRRRKAPRSCAACRGSVGILSAVSGAPAARYRRRWLAAVPEQRKSPTKAAGRLLLLFGC